MKNIMELRKALKAKVLGDGRILAGWTSLAHPSIAEIFSRMGIDFLGIDLEHSTIDQEQSQRIIAACHAGGCLCLPRIPTHDQQTIKRLLDSGADGIIAPTVETAEQAAQLVTWMKYPPMGRRGYGIARAQGYGFDFEAYTTRWNDVSTLIVQIESVQGVDNIDAILSVEGVDGAMVGPYDLSGSLGVSGQIDHPKVREAGKRVAEACRRHGKASGTQSVAPTVESVNRNFEDGYTFVVLASDIFLLWKWSAEMAELGRAVR